MPDRSPSRKEKARLLELRRHDLQIAFLALLTSRGIKPASRWEKPLPAGGIKALRGLGLSVRVVRRKTLSGREVLETLFAADPAGLEKYAARFDGRHIDKSPETRRFEGLFFGYPPCCVEAFAKTPYAPNGLAAEDQAILFHWACPGCVKTPVLLETYHELRDILLEL